MSHKIIWTAIDEAPALASYSLLPIIRKFSKEANIEVETADISLAGRILSTFPENLTHDQKVKDYLSELGEIVNLPEANIIKLPNISASVPQLKAAIAELQQKGYNIPDYPENPTNDVEKEIKNRYAKCLGSAVNPVLRMGNSDRRAALAVKKHAQKNPHRLRAWDEKSTTHVSHMDADDFYGNEKSIIIPNNVAVKIVHEDNQGKKTILGTIQAQAKEILDATFMNVKALQAFYSKTLDEAKQEGNLFSLHLKATMMKVSDPILFGYAVSTYFKEVFEKYKSELASIEVNPNLGLADLYKKLNALPADKKSEIEQAILTTYTQKADLAMVNSDLGITNLHNPNDVIVDASMPVVIRDGGKMWNKDGKVQNCIATIPDRTYATFYAECIEESKRNGAFNVSTMGNVSNVGLMAQKAEEYGSHPTTFEIEANGKVYVIDENEQILMQHEVEKGDIWRMSRVKDIPIKDWVRLAVERARLTGDPAIFWLDKNRPHDANMIQKVEEYLKDYDTNGLDIQIMSPVEATRYTLQRVREGKNTISVTGNVLRDYLTDLFPILELGTSARMLSIVPLIAGGGLFETGAGGSAPKHVQQFIAEGHLRWDSLGEYLAFAESLRFIAQKTNDKKIEILAKALDEANDLYLENQKNPGRDAGEPDAKTSHFYLALYWAKTLANQKESEELANIFKPLAEKLIAQESTIINELMAIEGKPQDIGGYYQPIFEKADSAMRPSKTLNSLID